MLVIATAQGAQPEKGTFIRKYPLARRPLRLSRLPAHHMAEPIGRRSGCSAAMRTNCCTALAKAYCLADSRCTGWTSTRTTRQGWGDVVLFTPRRPSFVDDFILDFVSRFLRHAGLDLLQNDDQQASSITGAEGLDIGRTQSRLFRLNSAPMGAFLPHIFAHDFVR